jgi:tartrate-resistant acid phosphatase type 5
MRFLLASLAVLLVACPNGDDDDTVVLTDDDDSVAAEDDDAAPDDDDTAIDDDDTAPDDDDTTPPVDDDDTTPDDDDTTPAPAVVRFIAMGDVGEGYSSQHPASLVIQDVCDNAGGCDFVLLMGDNFYDVGVDSVTDPQWADKFEDPYANLDLPFYPVLGNHDGGLFGTGVELWKGDVQVEYSDYSDKWTMPGRYYKHSWSNVDLFGIDTSSIFFDGLGSPFITDYEDLTDDQGAWLQSEWAGASTGQWRFVYGHHPYLSNGPHGNAGTYEGIPFVPYVSGDEIKDFLDDNVCGSADFYLCGHDHSRQWMVDTCNGTQLIVTGAGAKTSSIDGSQGTYFEDADTPGFFFFEISGNTATVQTWDVNGVMGYESVITK